MSMENANEVRYIQEKYADKGIAQPTKLAGEDIVTGKQIGRAHV